MGEIEARVARGHVGIDNDDDAPQFKALFTSFLDALTNRNAADDRDVRGGEAPEVTDERRRRAIKTGIATNKRPALPPTLHPPPVIALWLPDPPSLLQSLPTFESRFVMRTASNTSWRLFALGSPVLSPR
ncbi:MAG: hypothetical protein ABI704_11100 [Kofleriaceae bacterium]